MPIRTRELTPDLWPDFERLFGPAGGVCGGCWCMFWRTAKGVDWPAFQGAKAKAAMRRLVREGKSLGILAYDGDEPVGWCSFGPRVDYARLDRSPSMKVDDAEQVWSVPCFYVKASHRRQGVARALLDAALRAMRRRGAKLAEGYPYKVGRAKPLSPAFTWTGTLPMFERAGFELVGPRPKGKQRVRKQL